MAMTSRAAVLRSANDPYTLEEVTLADLRPHEVLVEIVSAGMCHTDMAVRESEALPMIPGHEGAGIVTAVGSGIDTIEVGDHVVLSLSSCGHCPFCLRGEPAYCTSFMPLNVIGRYPDGSTGATDGNGDPVGNRFFGQSSFATHAIADERSVVVVNRDLPLEILGPLGCGFQTGAGCVLNEMKLRPGQSIVVFGAGGVGMAAVMAAKLSGASDIVVVDLHESRLEMARELGATRTVDATADGLVNEILGTNSGIDYVLETSGVGSALHAGLAALATGGLAVTVTGDRVTGFPPEMLVGKRATFSLEGNAHPQLFIPQLLRFWREGRFPFDKLIQAYSLDRINDAEADSKSGKAIKPVLQP